MTKKVYQLLGQDAPNYKYRPGKVRHTVGFGLEVEAENVTRITDECSALWRTTQDGSLRNHGMEFLCPGPQSGTKLDDMLEVLEASASRNKYTFGPRTSVHVHVDVRDITSPALFRFIMLYAMFERVLYAKFAGDRYSNNFCVPLAADNDLVTMLADVDRSRVIRSLQDHAGNGLRYRGLNIESLFRFGTLEFRFCAGTADATTLTLLCNALADMREYAVRHTSIARYIDFASEGDLTNLFYRVFGDADTLADGQDVFTLTRDGARIVERIIYAKELNALQVEIAREVRRAPRDEYEDDDNDWEVAP